MRIVERYPRSVFLTVWGVLYIGIGLGWVSSYSPIRQAAIGWLPDFVSQEFIGLLWVVSGFGAFICGLVRSGREVQERLGFFFLQFIPLLVSLYYLGAQVVYLLPPPTDGGAPQGVHNFLTYFTIYAGAFIMARVQSARPHLSAAEAKNLMTASIPVVGDDKQ